MKTKTALKQLTHSLVGTMIMVLPLVASASEPDSFDPMGLRAKVIQAAHARFRDSAGSGSTSPTNPPPPTLPIRKAKVRFNIEKHTYVQGADGSYSFVTSPVCRVDGTTGVYDLRNNPNGSVSVDQMTCASTLQGQAVTVNFGAALTLGSGKLFDTVEDFKVGVAYLYANLPTTGPGGTWEYTVGGSHDLNAVSTVLFLDQVVSYNCSSTSSPPTPSNPSTSPTPAPRQSADGNTSVRENAPCSPSVTEYFTATADLED